MGRHPRKWLTTGAKTLCIGPGSPWRTATKSSFDCRLRDEFLNGEIMPMTPPLRGVNSDQLVPIWNSM